MHAQLLAAVQALPEKHLASLKVHQLIEGVASHDVYHDGQIRLLKRMV